MLPRIRAEAGGESLVLPTYVERHRITCVTANSALEYKRYSKEV
jgi:hypothetical protein